MTGEGDAGVDAGSFDAGVDDAGALDAGAADAGVDDAGALDAGAADAGVDAGPPPCPVAAGGARLAGTQDAPSVNLGVEPLQRVELDGTPSSAFGGATIASYAWQRVSAPAGVRGSIEPTQTPGISTTWVSLVGEYRFELSVTDSWGTPACVAAAVTVTARPSDALWVELTWTTPGDPDATDLGDGSGADVDLHLLEPGGTWSDPNFESDCFFGQPEASWGVAGVFDDNCIYRAPAAFHVGGGPEVTAVASPHPTDGSGAYNAPYTVGVYYYDSHMLGASFPTVRVYIDGELTPRVVWPSSGESRQLTLSDPSLSALGDFWLAGEIDWSGGAPTFLERDEVYTGFADCSTPVCTPAPKECACP